MVIKKFLFFNNHDFLKISRTHAYSVVIGDVKYYFSESSGVY